MCPPRRACPPCSQGALPHGPATRSKPHACSPLHQNPSTQAMRGPSSHYCHGEWPSHNAAGGTLCPAGTLPSVTNETQWAGKPATGFATFSQRPGQLPLPEPQLVLWAVKTCQEMSMAAAHGSPCGQGPQHPWPRDASPRQWDSAAMARSASHTHSSALKLTDSSISPGRWPGGDLDTCPLGAEEATSSCAERGRPPSPHLLGA